MTNNEKYIVDMYVRYFGRAADAATIATYAEDKKTSVILKNIIADADAEKAGLSTSEFVDNAFQNLFGRNATTKEMSKYYKVVDAGKDLPINSIVKSAAKNDKKVYDNKKAVALKYAELGGTKELDLSKISKDNTVDLNKVVTLTDLTNAIANLAGNSGIPTSFDGKTFVLTKGVDAGKDFIGTNKNDQFIADNSVTGTVNASTADTLDGGKGTKDTFELYDDASNDGSGGGASSTTTGSLPTLKNIENVVIYDTTIATASTSAIVDLTKWDSVETLFLVRDANEKGYNLGEKVKTVNLVDVKVNQILNFDDALTAATVGVNNVTGATAVTVNDELKTLTINAYGKASEVELDQATDTIETLNITGRADLALDFVNTATSKIVTIDGSKAQGKLDLDLKSTTAATLKTVKTGTGDDKLALSIAVASGTTIDLGAGNDKLVAGTAGSVVTSTTTVIDGGAGIDSLDAALVTVGNAGVFASFETLSLTTTTTDLDIALLKKSTFATIAIDGATGASTVRNVSTSQSLTVNNAVAATDTTLLFKNVDGKADAYTINFNADTTGSLDAGNVAITGIETININSVGKTGADNTIELDAASAKSVVITGNTKLTIEVDDTTNLGGGVVADDTNGLGVSTIDASKSTAGITIAAADFEDITTAYSGLTIKGGAGDDNIKTGAIVANALKIETGDGKDTIDLSGILFANTLKADKIIVNAGAGDDTITLGEKGGTLTGGTGNDTFIVGAAKAGAAAAATTVITDVTTAVITTITDFAKGDIIKGVNTAALTKGTITGATNLDGAFTKALTATTSPANTWFQYGNDTYLVVNDATALLTGGDVIVKLNGLVDLGNSTVSAGELTIA